MTSVRPFAAITHKVFRTINESLNNNDGIVNENGKKATGLGWQNNNFAHASRFFMHFFAVTALL